MKPSLALFDSDGNFNHDKWLEFKHDYNVNRQTMAMLLSVPGDTFFSTIRQKKSKNKSVEEISEYAAEFFRKFLDVKGNFEQPTPSVRTRLFDSSNFKFLPWSNGYAWADGKCAFGLIDLRCVPGNASRVDDTASLYFGEFLAAWERTVTDPTIRTPDVWLFISENIDRHAQALVFGNKLKDEFQLKTSNYMPSSNERFNGIQEGKVLDKHLLPLLFLIKKSSYSQDLIRTIPDTFKAPALPLYFKAGMYREHELCVTDTELRLEFYGRVLKMFSTPGDRFLSIMAGSKPMLAGIVSIIRFCVCHMKSMSIIKFHPVLFSSTRAKHFNSILYHIFSVTVVTFICIPHFQYLCSSSIFVVD